jgi:hypothetical protein
MLASKFALGVLIAFMFILGIVLKRRGLEGVAVFLMVGLGVFFLIDFYYLPLPPSYFLAALIATSRPIPAYIGVSQGPLAAFLATFSWQAYYSIPHVWSLFEVALVAISLLIASFLRIKRRHDTLGFDILFLASATFGLVTFTWERPLVLLAPLSAIFVATTIGQFSHEYMPKKISVATQIAAIGALLIQLVVLVPQAYFSHALFQYDASAYIPALLGLPPLRTSGEIVLSFLVLFSASASVPLLDRKKRSSNPLSAVHTSPNTQRRRPEYTPRQAGAFGLGHYAVKGFSGAKTHFVQPS